MAKRKLQSLEALDELLNVSQEIKMEHEKTHEIEVYDEPEEEIHVGHVEVSNKKDKRADDIEDDYNLARQTLRTAVTKGAQALSDMMVVLNGSDSPRAFEVASGLMKNLAEVSKDLMNLQKTRNDVDNPSGAPKAPEGPQTVENNYFLSTEEIAKLANEKDKT